MQCATNTTQREPEQDKFGLRMRTALLHRGMSIKDLCKKVKCHRNSIRLAEHGLAPQVRHRISKFLHI